MGGGVGGGAKRAGRGNLQNCYFSFEIGNCLLS